MPHSSSDDRIRIPIELSKAEAEYDELAAPFKEAMKRWAEGDGVDPAFPSYPPRLGALCRLIRRLEDEWLMIDPTADVRGIDEEYRHMMADRQKRRLQYEEWLGDRGEKVVPDQDATRRENHVASTPAATATKAPSLPKKGSTSMYDVLPAGIDLTERQSQIFELAIEYELTQSDIAKRLGLHHSTVQGHIQAVSKKRSILKGSGNRHVGTNTDEDEAIRRIDDQRINKR